MFKILLLILASVFLSAHSGRTDSDGGHYNRTTGEYHYHNGGDDYNNYVDEPYYEDSRPVYLNKNYTEKDETSIWGYVFLYFLLVGLVYGIYSYLILGLRKIYSFFIQKELEEYELGNIELSMIYLIPLIIMLSLYK